ncbi:chromosome partitioning protein [Pseudomonas syringae]|uniref:ParA family protein n=2 Tax=Pseudomonas TaxID=286 RepID=UPI000BB65530|nr:ParA family protein [Pseudomonas syringae]PBP62555.1 chromosome partitioning protein [Pseudomonas syringae]
MATVVGFISEKGGVGKTTSCYHVAVALNRFHDKRVLVIDADYQRGGISGRFFPDLIEEFGVVAPSGATLYQKYQQLYSAGIQTPDIDVVEFADGLFLAPADNRLSTVSVNKLPSTNNIRENNVSLLAHMKTIDFVLQPMHDEYDYVLIDSHPEISDVLKSIIYASDYCVSPVKLDRQSAIGVASVMAEIDNVNSDIAMIRSALKIEDGYRDTIFSGAIGMMAREYAEALKYSEHTEYRLLRSAGPVFENYVTEGDGLRMAAANRQSVYDGTGANAAKQAQQFRSLTKEFMRTCP